ncbi:MAG: hypothetical protein AABW51_02070 [Nanoarchaeota archaeon]
MFIKKAQGVIEFIILFGAALLFFVVIIATIQESQSQKNKEKERLVAQNVALDIQDEINLAAGSSEGYERNFTTPENIMGLDYDINVSQGYIFLILGDYVVDYNVVQVVGQIQKGNNLIKKENGTVYLNP